MKAIYFIINPQARNGYSQKVWAQVEKELCDLKIPYMAFFTKYRGNAQEIVHSIVKKSKGEKIVIVAVGGDGTMNEVVNGVVKYKNVITGFIPGGSGNDFSRGYHIPKDPIAALKLILRQIKKEDQYVDIGRIEHGSDEAFFISSMGAGFDALVSKEANSSRMKGILNRLGLTSFVYVYFLLKNLFTYELKTVEVVIDGKTHLFESTWFVTVSNQPYYGGGMKISPEASPYDGLLDVTVVQKLSRVKLLFVFITVFWAGHTRFREVKFLKGRSIGIQSQNPMDVHVDGEYIGGTPLKIQACHQVLPILKRGIKNEEEVKELTSNDCN
ncbi:diacylglycerol/lipid kinase family protein [Cytobacillus sp. FJAT-54145]|uniref:Diacylglycerol/lipid kinase family protein n=1 Tax=Cytobacillus spartinae TaxID=3299023 RepID=A0ABW6KGT7_9BACI